MNLARQPLSRLMLSGLLMGSLLTGTSLQTRADVEPNNTFATREILTPGTTSLSGEITADNDFSVANFVFNETLSAGNVLSRTINGQPTDRLFALYIDNTVGAGTPDTLIRTLDENNVELGFNDDGSPLGDGFASGLLGFVNPDGTVRYQISGYPDFDFDGSHAESGDISVFLKYAAGDVDFYSLGNLKPGSTYSAEILSGSIDDSFLGQLDASGNFIATDDDSGAGLLSLLSGIVPADGVLNLAVTSFPDLDFAGNHFGPGTYNLRLTVVSVPEPGMVAFALTGGLALSGMSLRRRRARHSK